MARFTTRRSANACATQALAGALGALALAMLAVGPGTARAQMPPQAAAPALSWRIEGSATMPARIALPPAAELLVEWRATPHGRPLAATRIPTAGRQVPLPFALDLPANALEGDRDGFVQVAVLVANAPRYVGTALPVLLPAQPGPVRVREIRLAGYRPLAFASVFACGGRRVAFGMEGEMPMLDIDGRRLAMRRTQSASGARYEARNDEETQFWSRGREATLVWKGAAPQDCRPVGEPREALEARGQEPGWSLSLAPQRLVLRLPDGEILTRPPVPRRLDDDTHVLALDTPRGPMTLTLIERLCRDTMSGMPFPVAVRLKRDDANAGSLRGCGGETSEVLAGGWSVERIAGRPLVDRSRVTLEFGPEQRLSGRASCNRYFAGYSLTGEGLTIGQAGSTQMACPEALMRQEQLFLQALGKVRGLSITPEGALELRLEDGGTILARR